MLTDPNKFEINLDGIAYNVTRSIADENVYRLKSILGTYLIAKDFYNVWVELTRKTGSADIPLNKIARHIEEYCNPKHVSA